MHESKSQISAVLTTLMKTNGYRKRNLSWHKQTADTILVFHIEKNRWGANQYDIEMGIYLRSLGDELTPPIFRCQIQPFFEKIVPDVYEYRQVCDFEYPSFTTVERLERIKGYASEIALPWLDSHSTLPALKLLAQKDYQSLSPHILFIRATYDYLREVA